MERRRLVVLHSQADDGAGGFIKVVVLVYVVLIRAAAGLVPLPGPPVVNLQAALSRIPSIDDAWKEIAYLCVVCIL